MKARLIGWLTALTLFTGGAAWAQGSPEAMVKSTVDEVLVVLRQNKDPQELRRLAGEKVLPHFDFERMTRLSVGRPWQEASTSQREALVTGFRSLLVNTYSVALGSGGKPAEKVDVKPAPGGGDETVVRTVAHRSGKEPVAVDYRVARNGGGAWKVYDVIVEGVSLVQTYRGTFAAEIARIGVDGLIRTLEQRANAPRPS